MRRRLSISLASVLVATVGLSLTQSVGGSAAVARRDVTINREQTVFAGGPFAGDHVTFYGAGSWNPSEDLVDISGSFIHRHADGTLVARGVWKATDVDNFTSFGTVPPFLEGGVLQIDANFFDTSGHMVGNFDVYVTCLLGSPPPGAQEGVTIPGIGATKPVEGPGRFTLFEDI